MKALGGSVAGPSGAAGEPLEDRVHRRLLASAPARTGQAGDDDLHDAVLRLVREEAPLLGGPALLAAVERVRARVQGLGALEPLLADPTVSEVMVNGPGAVWVERAGRLERTAVTLDGPAIEHVIERIVAPLGLRVDRASPVVDARLPDGSRVNAVVPPLAIDGPCLTIRRFGAHAVDLDAVCPPGVAQLLRWAVAARCNIVVAGGTGAGKTTLLNALAGAIPRGERIVTVEDAAELRLEAEHVVRLESRSGNADGAGAVSIRALVRNALRMRPDRIVVGEVRGAEALDMLQAMSTGHEGSLSTCHANGARDALRRLETMALMGDVALPLDAVREQVRAAVDLVVQVARRRDGTRGVVEVAEVAPPGAEGPATIGLTGAGGLHALPARPARSHDACDPDPAWVRS